MDLAGFGNHHATEAIPGALPRQQNSPQQCPFGLYAEQLSGSAFTQPRSTNRHSWLYRALPSVVRNDYVPYPKQLIQPFVTPQSPNPLRWSAFPAHKGQHEFLDGLLHIAGNSHVNAFHYQCNHSMNHRYFYNHDGEFLFVPYLGDICLHTELGKLTLRPGMIGVIPRGIWFRVELHSSQAAGYLCENNEMPLTLPPLGPLGANGLANPRHFLYPTAAFDENDGPVELICKYQQHLWQSLSPHSPLNVVAWHGNYAPYCYDLSLFNTMGSVSFDHPDPSIFTVLTSESYIPGVANLDFVIFPQRWIVSEHTFRPPYFHRNVMNEFMGLIQGEYDAKQSGFSIGGVSIHNGMTSHGPDLDSYQHAVASALAPEQYQNTLAFMFETRKPWLITEVAMHHPQRQTNYTDCWKNFPRGFKGWSK
jgi:homogentisate 1,2-dioxygenase